MLSSSTSRGPLGHTNGGKPERLFRAAISAFCALTRPTRREVAQLDDLTLPLFPSVSGDALRHAAAALSEVPVPPPLLCRRLANEPIEISAPLLMRSPVLADIDLIMLIGRHGMGHARVIARRPSLDPAIAALIQAIGVDTGHEEPSMAPPEAETSPGPAIKLEASVSAPQPGDSARAPDNEPVVVDPLEEARVRLREMMRPAGDTADDPRPAVLPALRWPGRPDAYAKLLSTALTGVPALYQTALADLIEIDMDKARVITGPGLADALPVALRALDLPAEKAFLLAACIAPGSFAHAAAIARFLDRYHEIDAAAAETAVRNWKAECVARAAAAVPDEETVLPPPANTPLPVERLKAS